MKKLITVLSAAAIVFVFAGCNPNATKTESSNLDKSQGTNEVKGTWYEGDYDLVFGDSTLNIYDCSGAVASINSIPQVSSRSVRPTITADSIPELTYKYTYNSKDKTLEFQLSKMWDEEGVAKDYKAAVEEKKAYFSELGTSIISVLNSNSAYEAQIQYLNTYGKTFNNPTYGYTVDSMIQQKIKDYLAPQEALLEDYLNKKYNAVIKAGYSFNDSEQLKIEQKFLGDLTDASAEFTSNDSDIFLNDYEELIPMYVKESDKYYEGIPEFNEEQTSVTAKMYMGATETSGQTQIISDIVNKFASANLSSLSQENRVKLQSDVLSNETTTFAGWMDDIFNSYIKTFKADVAVADDGSKVTFTLTEDFADSWKKNETADLEYSPFFDYTLRKGE